MSYEIQGNLARLLAAENLVVEHKAVETASFDVDKRVLTLPIWEGSKRMYDMLVGHEVGHALYTPNDSWDEWVGTLPKSYLNVTEDARIEKLMKRKFPGIIKDFYAGYQELNDRDFFGVKDTDYDTLNLIDKINLYFKIGAYEIIPFTAPEKALRDAVADAETFMDAIDAARAIYEYSKEQQSKVEAPLAPQSSDSEEGSKGEVEPITQDSQNVSEDTGDDMEDGGEDWDSDSDTDMDPLESLTDTNLNENLRDNTRRHDTDSSRDIIEIDPVDLNKIIVPWDRIKSSINAWENSNQFDKESENYIGDLNYEWVDNEYRKFKRECSREVNYLSKEFEMKKSASAYSRQQVSRTGVLNTAKLHTYKFNEDLFKKVTVTPDGKNHGLIFYLDWSGSMAEHIHDTFKQLMSLCLFCRKSDIPFDVYIFLQDGSWSNEPENYEGRPETFFVGNYFHLLNVLSSSQNNKTFDEAMNYIWRASSAYYYHYGPGHRDYENRGKAPSWVASALSLSGTPLNEAIACLPTLIPNFQSKNNVEKTHVVILTDGEAQQSAKLVETTYNNTKHMYRSALYSDVVIRDRKTGNTYGNKFNKRSKLTTLLLRFVRGRFPQCNLLGFRIITTRDFNYVASTYAPEEVDDMKKQWAKNKSAKAEILGYQEMYFMSDKSLNVDSEFTVDEDATKSQIKKAFTKSLKAKSNNKMILSSFIGQIA